MVLQPGKGKMGRKKLEPQAKTLKMIEEEIEAATKEVRISILRLVQSQVIWEKLTGQEVKANASKTLQSAIEIENDFKIERTNYKQKD